MRRRGGRGGGKLLLETFVNQDMADEKHILQELDMEGDTYRNIYIEGIPIRLGVTQERSYTWDTWGVSTYTL